MLKTTVDLAPAVGISGLELAFQWHYYTLFKLFITSFVIPKKYVDNIIYELSNRPHSQEKCHPNFNR